MSAAAYYAKLEREVDPRGRRPAWSVAQAMRDGKRQGYALAPDGYGPLPPLSEWGPKDRERTSSIISVRGPLASILFNDPEHPEYPHALADVTLAAWVERYGFAGLEGYALDTSGTLPPPRVPFFIPLAAVPLGRRVDTLKNGLRYVVPDGEQE